MTLAVTQYGDNPQVPGVIANSYVPDQLIAGNMKIVTDTVTITGAAALKRGSVLGQVLTGVAGPAVAGANTGNGTVTAITTGPKTKAGTYTIKFKSATTYDVISPAGDQLAEGLALGAYADVQINFTVAAGGTAFVAGDSFTIPVTGSMSYKLAAAAAVDGSETPVVVLLDDVDASAGDVLGPIMLQGEVNGNSLILGAGITVAAAKIALQAQKIYVKSALSAADPS